MHSRLQGRAHSGITRCKSTQQFATCTNNRLRHALHPRNPCAPCKASVRQKKDPSSFRDMDEAREYLHAEANWSGPVAGLLNWLSNSAFGAQKGGLNLGNLYRQWLHQQNQQQQADSSRSSSSSSGAGAAAAASAPDLVAKLAVLMLVSEHRVQIMADKYPQVLDIPLTDIAQRLLLLKQLLPDCDVARMVELQPLMLLKCDEQYLLEVVKPRVDVLTAELPGANISGMVEEDPRLLFEELESSLPRFHELWPGRLLDESTFAASDPTELGLALRALSDKGPPRKY